MQLVYRIQNDRPAVQEGSRGCVGSWLEDRCWLLSMCIMIMKRALETRRHPPLPSSSGSDIDLVLG